MLLGPLTVTTESLGGLIIGPLAIVTESLGGLFLGPVTVNTTINYSEPFVISINTTRIGDRNIVVVQDVNLQAALTLTARIWYTTDRVFNLTGIQVLSQTEFSCDFPIDGVPIGAVCYLVVEVNGIESNPLQFTMQSHYERSGTFTTLNVDFNNLHPDSPLADPAYSDMISVGTQIDYTGISFPGGFPVSIAQNGLVTISNISASNFDQQVHFAVIQPIERLYTRSTEAFWIFDTPTPDTINAWLEDATLDATGYVGSAVANSGIFNGILSNVGLTASGTVVEVGTINGFLTSSLDNFTSIITGNLESAVARINASLDNVIALATGVVAATGAVPIRFRLKYTKIVDL